jgi:hypothetical protein
MMEESSMTIDVEKRVGQFVKLRDLKAELKAKHDDEMKPINDTMELIKDELKQAMHSFNVENMKTSSGTVSILNKSSASAADINAFWTWIITQGAFDMIDKKPNVTAITEYVKQNGVAPPGVNYTEYQDIGVRRK